MHSVQRRKERREECPYCSTEDHFKAAHNAPTGRRVRVIFEMHHKNWRGGTTRKREVEAVEHGEYWLATLTSENYLSDAFEGYTVEVLGKDYGSPMMAPGPLFGTTFGQTDGERLCLVFEACRVIGEAGEPDVRAHWHHGWERIITIRQDAFKESGDVKSFSVILRLFKHADRRGAKARFNLLKIHRAIQKLQARDEPVTVETVAAKLQSSAKGLKKWMEIEGETIEKLEEDTRRLTESMRRSLSAS